MTRQKSQSLIAAGKINPRKWNISRKEAAIAYLDLKELVIRLLEYGERDDELFTANMISLEEC